MMTMITIIIITINIIITTTTKELCLLAIILFFLNIFHTSENTYIIPSSLTSVWSEDF